MIDAANVFLSYSRPISDYQGSFLRLILDWLRAQSALNTIVLDTNALDPLSHIVRAIDRSSGLMALAFRRNLIGEGTQRIVLPDGTVEHRPLANEWLTSSYCHIEVALAFHAGIPMLILQEHDVVSEGVLDRSSTGDDIVLISKESLPSTPEALMMSSIGRRLEAWVQRVLQSGSRDSP